jgi:hypothetical protein
MTHVILRTAHRPGQPPRHSVLNFYSFEDLHGLSTEQWAELTRGETVDVQLPGERWSFTDLEAFYHAHQPAQVPA